MRVKDREKHISAEIEKLSSLATGGDTPSTPSNRCCTWETTKGSDGVEQVTISYYGPLEGVEFKLKPPPLKERLFTALIFAVVFLAPIAGLVWLILWLR